MPYNPDAMARATVRATLRTPRPLPAIDERLVAPGSRAEILEGRLVMSPPGADPPHAMRHLTLAYLLGAHVAPGYAAAIDMLTRTDETSDFAPDASVFPAGIDPETGGRRLDVLAFEIVSKQRLSLTKRKARKLVARGVERVFALVLTKNRALEWDRRTDAFRPIHLDEEIVHPSLAAPLPVGAMLDTARVDEAVLAALEARRPDLVARIEARGEARGEVRGELRGEARAEARAVRRVCRVLDIPIDDARSAWIDAASLEELRAISTELERARRWPTSSAKKPRDPKRRR